MISAVYGAVSLVAAIDTLMGGLMSSEAFMRSFDGLVCCFCGCVPYPLRRSKGVEVELIGT